MITLITWEHESSKPEVREFETVAACYNLAANGGLLQGADRQRVRGCRL